MAFLDIVFEFAFVFRAVNMCILAISIGHIILKLALINVTFGMPESTLALRFVEIPLSFVVSAIGPVLDSVTMSKLLNIWIIIHGSFAISLIWSSVATIISIGDFHLRSLIPLLHLSSIY